MKYPIGIQTFSEIRNGGYVYVDKTSQIRELVDNGKYYFLSRPRRFGKSLLLSTIESYFTGEKQLFEGLDIYAEEKKWLKYPVLHFDLNSGYYNHPRGVRDTLESQLSKYEKAYEVDVEDRPLAERFHALIAHAAQTKGLNVVLLIDEYDKPLLEAMGNPDLEESHRNELKPFYSVLKSCDRYIRFAFITGVTKIGKLSIFSDLNNLYDISMLPKYSAICGVTEEEIHKYFNKDIKDFAEDEGVSYDVMVSILKYEYDGYRFSRVNSCVINPFSMMCALESKEIDTYWFATGTPSYLVKLLKISHYNLWNIDGVERKSGQMMEMRPDVTDPIPVIYQSGYLTIKDYDKKFNIYRLGFPNHEVREGFLEFLLPSYTGDDIDRTFDPKKLVEDINSGNIDGFMCRLQAIFANIPYVENGGFDYESEFRNVMYIIFSMLGFYTDSERHVRNGRIDFIVRTATIIYIMEFKIGKTPKYALGQIEDKEYIASYVSDGRKIIKIGVTFSKKKRNIESWEYETI